MPGPRSRQECRRLAHFEAPGVNTLPASGVGLVWEEARGANVLDVDGNRFIDLTAGFGVAAVGHRHPRVVRAVRYQAGRLVHGLGDVHAHRLRSRLAERLAARAPVDEPQVYFGISGADAVEIAVKTARLATDRGGIVAFEPAYHGLTLGALAATSRPGFRDPFGAHLDAHVHRLPWGCPAVEIEALLAEHGDIAGVLLEPVVGREAVRLPPVGWLAAVADLCRRHGALLIADEIFTGFGRTGYRFAVEADAVRPDLLCCGKALAGGLPIAAVVGRRPVMAAWESPGEALHAATFTANPLACAAALEVLQILDDEDLVARAARLGAGVAHRCAAWPGRFSGLQEVRGRGLFWGLELASRARARAVSSGALERGLLILAGGEEARVVQLVPPLTITERQLTFTLDIVEELLGAP